MKFEELPESMQKKLEAERFMIVKIIPSTTKYGERFHIHLKSGLIQVWDFMFNSWMISHHRWKGRN